SWSRSTASTSRIPSGPSRSGRASRTRIWWPRRKRFFRRDQESRRVARRLFSWSRLLRGRGVPGGFGGVLGRGLLRPAFRKEEDHLVRPHHVELFPGDLLDRLGVVLQRLHLGVDLLVFRREARDLGLKVGQAVALPSHVK